MLTSRTVDFRYKIIRGGADYGFLQAVGSPVLRCDKDAEIKMSFSGTFRPEARDAAGNMLDYDLLTDEIEPVLVIDGVEHKLGVFMPATVTPSEDMGAAQIAVEAYDRCWRVRDVNSENLLFFARGTPYLTAMEQLLTAAGITTVLATPSSDVLSEDREDWDIGTSYLTIANELLSEINYKPMWFNAAGVAILEPVSVPTAENIQHTLNGDNVESLLVPQIQRETDIYQAPNVFICICSNPDKGADLVAKAENTNPQSPLSIPRRGRRIVSVERVNNIASQAELQAYADKKRDDSMITGETIQVQTALLPGYGVADVTALHYGDLNAICIERAWEMELAVGGPMRHTLERVVYNLE